MEVRLVFFVFLCGNIFYMVHSEEPQHCSMFKVVIDMAEKMAKLQVKMEKMQEKLDQLEAKGTGAVKGSGTVYIRWGRSSCDGDNADVYPGYIAGKKYTDKGSGNDNICLPADPSWLNYTDGFNAWVARIHGTEIDIDEVLRHVLFDRNVYQQDMPCVMCKTPRSISQMFPARSSCFPGWKLEYKGYLMTSHHSQDGSHNHICVDSSPQFVPNGRNNNDEHVLYPVEAVCGSLPCPPYVEGRELACVVCSM